ncbi:MAG TPA: hypothetical protein ACQGQI_09205 [Xylella sp.]
METRVSLTPQRLENSHRDNDVSCNQNVLITNGSALPFITLETFPMKTRIVTKELAGEFVSSQMRELSEPEMNLVSGGLCDTDGMGSGTNFKTAFIIDSGVALSIKVP